MNAEGLEPCPFCGEAERVQVDRLDGGLKAVCCDNCGCHGPVEMTEAEAVSKWNQRQPA